MNGQVTHTHKPTGWIGWSVFAATMMMLAGVFQFIFGLTAVFNDNFFVVTSNQLLLFDITAWGWIHMVAGVLIFFAGLSALSGGMFGRIVGTILAFLSAIVAIMSVPAYPIWSIIIITVDVLVIYALTAHGGELKEE